MITFLKSGRSTSVGCQCAPRLGSDEIANFPLHGDRAVCRELPDPDGAGAGVRRVSAES